MHLLKHSRPRASPPTLAGSSSIKSADLDVGQMQIQESGSTVSWSRHPPPLAPPEPCVLHRSSATQGPSQSGKPRTTFLHGRPKQKNCLIQNLHPTRGKCTAFLISKQVKTVILRQATQTEFFITSKILLSLSI